MCYSWDQAKSAHETCNHRVMKMRYFDLFDDMYIKNRWFLKTPLAEDGSEIDARTFTEGKPVDVYPAFLPIRKKGTPLDFTMADHEMPIANARAARIFERLAAEDVQLIPIRVEGQSEEYFIVNATRALACVDETACEEVTFWTKDDFRPDLAGTYRSIIGLRIDPARASGHSLFWVKDWVQLIASEAIKEAFEKEGIIGAKFTPV